MEPPQPAIYSSLQELVAAANGFATTQGYKFVVVRSKTNAQGQKTWVHLACDRHGAKRNTHNLTEETRKKNRRSRRCGCPMHCIATKTIPGLWELIVRNTIHNHEPYEEAVKKKKDVVAQHSSELVNLPLLQTPSSCTADFCLVPMGTPSPSVSAEIAEVQRLLKRSGLHYSMHAAGTTVEGTWDDVMKIIGQAHSLLHGSGVVRIQTDIRVGSRTDKKQSFEDKVAAVNALLEDKDFIPQQESDDDGMGDDTMDPSVQQMDHSHLVQVMNHNIAPDLDRVMVPQMNQAMAHQMAHSLGHLQHSPYQSMSHMQM